MDSREAVPTQPTDDGLADAIRNASSVSDIVAAAFCWFNETHDDERWYSLSTDGISELIERALEISSWQRVPTAAQIEAATRAIRDRQLKARTKLWQIDGGCDVVAMLRPWRIGDVGPVDIRYLVQEVLETALAARSVTQPAKDA